MTTSAPQTPSLAAPWRLLDGYQPDGRVHDELVSPGGSPRAHYEGFVRSVESLGRHELASRWESAKRTVRDNGVTYNVYGDPHGIDRPWTLDMMPLVVSFDEWSRLAAALVQRTRVLNAMLADLYGPQRLLRETTLPPSLVLGNPGFLRPCHGIPVPRGVHLHLHAVDLARSTDGQWWALADRTQAPSGAGYALENRIVLSRSLPEAFRDCQVQRLASFFAAQRDTLTGLAPARETPRVVLLTPGPLNETYFEHAYLARYLGFTLVEGGDLTVRDRRVFIKTLDGLQPVDVVFRRLDDSYCDPLELRSDSTLGVAGLVEAARAGNVAIANALGSGVIETPAISRFLPGVCRHVLGEELLLPSVPTRWCGVPEDLQYVVDHLDRLVIKRTFPPVSRQALFGRVLTAAQRSELADQIRRRPEQFVCQDEVALSKAPVWQGQQLEPRSLVLRMYVAAVGDSYAVMPGGLTRIAASGAVPIVSMRRGGGSSKDTWVLAAGPISTMTLLAPPTIRVQRERRTSDLPSRVADNLFWLGRYAERAEHVVRLLRAVVARLTDEATTEGTPELLSLLRVLVALDLVPPRCQAPMTLRELEHELGSFLFKPGADTRMHVALEEVRRIASAVRDRLSIDTWRILNQLRQDFRLRHGRIQLDDVLMHLNRMIGDLAAFSGMEMENMTRGHGWRFLDIGRRLERSVNVAALLRRSLDLGASSHLMLGPLLEIADSAMTYRRRYFAQPQLAPVLDLLLADETNARSLAFQLAQLADHADRLPRDERAPSPTKEQRIIARMTGALAAADLDELAQVRPDHDWPALDVLLQSFEEDLRALSDAMTFYYFSHAELRIS